MDLEKAYVYDGMRHGMRQMLRVLEELEENCWKQGRVFI